MATSGVVNPFFRKTKIVFLILLVWVVWFLAWLNFRVMPAPWPPFYWALPLHGRVVAADTQAPLEGVVVVAYWELRGPWGISRGSLAVMESVTTKEGNFAFSWWHPRLRSPLAGFLESNAPRLVFFKSGYEWESCSDPRSSPNLNPFPTSDCNGVIAHLRKFEGTDKEYAKHLGFLSTSLNPVASLARNCEWTQIPRMVAALIHEENRFKKKRIDNDLPSLETFSSQNWCGSAEKVFRRYLSS